MTPQQRESLTRNVLPALVDAVHGRDTDTIAAVLAGVQASDRAATLIVALAAGWDPDDDDLDARIGWLASVAPSVVDEVLVERAIRGHLDRDEQPLRLNRQERLQAVQRMRARGASKTSIAATLHLSWETTRRLIGQAEQISEVG